jgi:hypothetical protein
MKDNNTLLSSSFLFLYREGFLITFGVDFTKLFAKQNDIGTQRLAKNRHTISPTLCLKVHS